MAARKVPLVSGEYYHIFNRGVASQPTFLNKNDYRRMIAAINFYRNDNLPTSYSEFSRLISQVKLTRWKIINQEKDFLIEIISYCLMPNHFHFLLKQTKKRGIEKFVGNLVNSYTKYFNTKRKRLGPLFQGRFKAVRVESEEQLLHLSRYIHLNPYSSRLLKNVSKLLDYPYSSFPEYQGKSGKGICTREVLLSDSRTYEEYKRFVLDNANYQRRLQDIKHLLFDS